MHSVAYVILTAYQVKQLNWTRSNICLEWLVPMSLWKENNINTHTHMYISVYVNPYGEKNNSPEETKLLGCSPSLSTTHLWGVPVRQIMQMAQKSLWRINICVTRNLLSHLLIQGVAGLCWKNSYQDPWSFHPYSHLYIINSTVCLA